ncbi:MAG: hypothetical protein ACYC0V_17985 [Armatimonadota bacterium]
MRTTASTAVSKSPSGTNILLIVNQPSIARTTTSIDGQITEINMEAYLREYRTIESMILTATTMNMITNIPLKKEP